MARFMAVHSASFTEDMFKGMAGSEMPAGFNWNHTYCDFENNKFFCDWDAPGKEELEQYFTGLQMPFDSVYPVRVFNAARADFE